MGPRHQATILFNSLPRGSYNMNAAETSRPQLRIRRINLDTGRENVAVISRRSKALRPRCFVGSAVSNYDAIQRYCWQPCS